MKKNKIGDDRLTNMWVGIGVMNAIVFFFLSGDFMKAIKGFLNIFGE